MSMKIVFVSLVAAGCAVEDPIVDPDAGDTSPTFTRAQARLLGEALAAGLEDTAERYGPVTTGASVVAPCATQSGDTSDGDGDSIPANATLTFDCSERRLGYTGTLTGVEMVSDLQPDALAWAFSASTDLHASLTGPFGGSVVTDTDGSIVASQVTSLGPFRLTSALDVLTVVTNVQGRVTELTEQLTASAAFRPDLQWTPGGRIVTGVINANGTWTVGIEGRSGVATLSTPTPLRLTPSCDTLITAGRVEAAFAAGAIDDSITVEWTGCGQSSVTYLAEPAFE